MAAVRISCKVMPRSPQDRLVAPEGEGGAWVVRLRAPAVDGKANAALIDDLAPILGVKKRSLRIVVGDKARHKILEVEGLSESEVEERLRQGCS